MQICITVVSLSIKESMDTAFKIKEAEDIN